MANQTQWIHRLLPTLQRQGWRYRWGSRHVVLYPADKKHKPFTVSGTPHCPYARENAIKQLRRAGALL